MTDEEHDALIALRRQVEELQATIDLIQTRVDENGKLTGEIHSDLYQVQRGAPKGDKPLMEMLRIMARAWKNSSWAIRAIGWLILTLGSLAVALREIIKWWPRG